MNDDEKQFENFVRGIKFGDAPNFDHRDGLEQNLLAVLAKQSRQKPQPLRIWGTIMKSRITKLAVAAVIIVAAIIVVYQMGGPVGGTAFADVVRPILMARTATYTVSIKTQDVPTLSFKVMWMEPHHVRQEMPQGTTIIGNLEEGKALVLLPDKKKAMVTSFSGGDNFVSFSELRQLIRDAQEGKEQSPEYLGKQRIDGREAIGYRIPKGRLPMAMPVTIWADAVMLLPIQMECQPSSGADGRQSTATLTDFQFDVELDGALFSLGVPEGYTTMEQLGPEEMGPAP